MARELLRLACTPQGEVFADVTDSAPGRGAYVCFDIACIHRALKSAKLAAALKRSVTTPTLDMLYRSAVRVLHTRLGSYLGMAQKAGTAISGATPLHKALVQQRIQYMVLAEDIAAARAEDYHAWCRRLGIPWLTLFAKAELGRLLGKSERSAVGLTDARLGERLYTTAQRLTQLRASTDSPEAPYDFTIQSSV